MEQTNKIELRGIVGNVRLQTLSERKMARFTVVTNYAYKDRNNNPVIETTWHPVILWEGKGGVELDRIEKGAKVSVWGRVRVQKYTSGDDVEKLSYEVIANKVSLIEGDDQMTYEFM